MTHSYDDPAGAMSRGKTERMLVRAFGVTLAVAGAVSLVHLVDQYKQAAPYRAAQALADAKRDAEKAQKDAEWRAERDAEEARLEARRKGGPAPVVVAPSSAEAINPTPSERPSDLGGAQEPARWSVPPRWPSVNENLLPANATRVTVEFRCHLGADGVLSGCAATERPAGAGLTAVLRPALARARMEPLRVNGRPVAGTATFSVSFGRRERVEPTRPAEPVSPPPSSAAAEPAPDIVPPTEGPSTPAPVD